jgi:hypothetical protein
VPHVAEQAGSCLQLLPVQVSLWGHQQRPVLWARQALTANGCVQHAHVTKFLVQVVRDLVTATIVADILT